jgi:hypothetical protein
MRRLALWALVCVCGTLLGSWLAWLVTPQTNRSILIIDKTVVNEQAAEHRALTWLLIHHRFVNDDGSYDLDDYVGFFPEGGGTYHVRDLARRSREQRTALADVHDAAFIVDTYGIFEQTWYEENPELGPVVDPSHKIYGGLDSADVSVLERMARTSKLLIAEFNVLAPPTPPGVRQAFEQLFGVHWTGWTGRQFPSLDSASGELPRWVVPLYRQQHDDAWPFDDVAGIMFAHLDGRIVILSHPKDLTDVSPVVVSMFDERDRFGLPAGPVPYPFWFDIVDPDSTMATVAYFHIPATPEAETVLARNGIPTVFPAVLEQKGLQLKYYFAGDFSDYPEVSMVSAYFRGFPAVRRVFASKPRPSSRREFYWSFYTPLVTRILKKYVPPTVE